MDFLLKLFIDLCIFTLGIVAGMMIGKHNKGIADKVDNKVDDLANKGGAQAKSWWGKLIDKIKGK
jgi:hypothetical protein